MKTERHAPAAAMSIEDVALTPAAREGVEVQELTSHRRAPDAGGLDRAWPGLVGLVVDRLRP